MFVDIALKAVIVQIVCAIVLAVIDKAVTAKAKKD